MNKGEILLAGLIPLAYLIGSVPFGLIVGRAKGIDPRTAGSGNIGATNVGRLLGGKFFALVFTLDLLKSLVPMLLAGAAVRSTGANDTHIFLLWIGVGLAAILGHMFSIFLGFKGGKGVATSAGVILGLYPYFTLPGLFAIGIWVAVFLIWRYVSLASIIGATLFPVSYALFGQALHWRLLGPQLPLLLFAILIAALVVIRHRTNIARLLAGTEHAFRNGESAS